jgi:amidase
MKLHAFADDTLGAHDAVALAALIDKGEISAREACAAAIARAQHVGTLDAVACEDYERALRRADAVAAGPFRGVPSFIKDNVDVAGLPTRHGSLAVPARPAKADGPFAQQYLAQGFVVLGKSRLPEFGFNATTEFAYGAPPTRNPWHTDYSCGASSGGAAALVAAGVVPVAHANDGGGSIRIPAACCGLVGLKATRGRIVDDKAARSLPVNIIGEGVVSRSVRDTAHFLAAMERGGRDRRLSPVGLVEGPGPKGLRIAVVYDSIIGTATDAATRETVRRTAAVLERLGHHIEEIPAPVPASFPDDFTLYWGFLACMVERFGRHTMAPGFDGSRIDPLTRGLSALFRSRLRRFPGALMRLRGAQREYQRTAARLGHDAVLSPVLAHTTPKLGDLSPAQDFDTLLAKLRNYVSFTPLNNVAGSPAITVPGGVSELGLPIGVQLQAAHGDERTLLEIAYALESAQPWPLLSSAATDISRSVRIE